MKILIFIHGAESFTDDESYMHFLQTDYIARYTLPWEDGEKSDYRIAIARQWQKLGGQVYYPAMPNKINARYRDWKIVFEGILAKLSSEDEITLVGTSLGGCFLLKYFSESKNFSHKINQIHLLAACLSEGDFTAPENYGVLQSLGDRVHIWHAEDDRVVPFGVAQELAKTLPDAQTHFFSPEKGYGHFHGLVSIPELEVALFS